MLQTIRRGVTFVGQTAQEEGKSPPQDVLPAISVNYLYFNNL